MPDFVQSLQGRDLGHLQIIAGLWGLPFAAPDARRGVTLLASLLLERDLVEEVAAALPDEGRAALEDLAQHGGRLPWALFARRYGAVRKLGPARRDREQPHLHPASAAEALWYRGLLAQAFFDTPNGPEEHAYIPDDLLALLPAARPPDPGPFGRLAEPAEQAYEAPASDRLVDHACTLLAALRLGQPMEEATWAGVSWELRPPLARPFPACPPRLTPLALRGLLAAAGLLDKAGQPQPEPVRHFLEAERAAALALLARAWQTAVEYNELRLLPTLQAEGEWKNQPAQARQALLGLLAGLPGRKRGEERPYWSLREFIRALHASQPDFQRPAGDYDSWYLRSRHSGEFLRGPEHWDAVDGDLVRFIIGGPLHWLGLVDLAFSADPASDPSARLTAFRWSAWAADLWLGAPPDGLPREEGQVQARSDALLIVPRLTPRALRYQLARFCEWEFEDAEIYRLRLSPPALARARQQGLGLKHLLGLLRRSVKALPPSLVKALERWEQKGVEARIESLSVLRLASPDLLQLLRSSKAGRFLGDPLGPTAVIVKPGAMDKVLAILAELGVLGQGE